MPATKKKEDRFQILTRRYYAEESDSSSGCSVKAIEILNSPKNKPRYIIIEEWSEMAHPLMVQCHSFNSEESMLLAFRDGLARYIFNKKPPQDPSDESRGEIYTLFKEFLDFSESSHFKSFSGYIATIDNNRSNGEGRNNATPWFMAQKGEKIRGDWVKGSGFEFPRSAT